MRISNISKIDVINEGPNRKSDNFNFFATELNENIKEPSLPSNTNSLSVKEEKISMGRKTLKRGVPIIPKLQENERIKLKFTYCEKIKVIFCPCFLDKKMKLKNDLIGKGIR